jgi:hypothetical protein
LNFDEQLTVIYRKWNTLGWRVNDEYFNDEIDVEALIAETTHAARFDGRLLKWLLTWFRDFGDLVNKKRLMHVIKDADGAVLGAVIEIAMQHGADNNFITVVKKCRPNKQPEVLQKGMEDVEIFIEEQKAAGKKEYKKWGLFCTMVEFYDDAVRTRESVLKNSELLAIRSVFGVNLRSELIYLLRKSSGLAVRRISKILGYAYSGVYQEVKCLVKNGLVEEEKGFSNIIRVSAKLEEILSLVAAR